MTIWYRCKCGGRWPDAGGVGGFGHAGFDRLDATWNLDRLLWDRTILPRYQPRAGTALVTSTVPPNISPGTDWLSYAYNDVAHTYANGGIGGTGPYTRIYVQFNGGALLPYYATGNPYYYFWDAALVPPRWVWALDTASPYYLFPIPGTPAGWSAATVGSTATCWFPDGVTGLYSTHYLINKATAWEEGLWTIYVAIATTTDSPLPTDINQPHELWAETSTFSFQVGGFTPFEQVIPYEGVTGASTPSYDLFAATQPTITSFTSFPASLLYGGGAIDLSWTTSDATALSIDNGIGDVTGLVTVNVPSVLTDTVFTLTATNGDIETKAFAHVTVDPASEPVIASFDALPASFPFGGGMTHLSWVILGGTQIRSIIVGSDPPIDVSALSEIDLPVTADTVFTLVSNGTGGLTDKAFVAVAVAPPALLFVSATPSLGHLAIQFSEDISGVFGAANDPEQWIITNTVTGLPLEVTAVSVVTDTVTLDTAEQVTGDAYTVIIPDTIVNTTMLMVFDGPQTEGFVGVGAQPTVLNINCVDARTIIIYFSEDVVEAEALNATNYAIDNGLLPVSLTKLSASVYKMTTTRQVTGTVYTATATGIHDLAGNEI